MVHVSSLKCPQLTRYPEPMHIFSYFNTHITYSHILLRFLLLRSTLWWCHVNRTGRFVRRQWICHCPWSAQSSYWLAFCSRELTCRPILSLPLSTHPISLQPPKPLPRAVGSSDNDIGKDFPCNTFVPVEDRIWFMHGRLSSDCIRWICDT